MIKWLIILLLLPFNVSVGFELPDKDPWYFQSNNSVEFWVPDKAQHYYGSQMMVELGIHPLAALSAGFLYEVWQERNEIGFSWKDLVANALGVFAGEYNTGQRYILIDYSVEQETIMLKGVVRI